jgi:hypothetical protein
MTARILIKRVPEWFGADAPSLEKEIRRDAERYLGTAAADRIIAGVSLDRLVEMWRRIPYVDSIDDLFDARWSLGITPLSFADLLKAGFGAPNRYGLAVELPYHRSRPLKREAVLSAVPWLDLMLKPESLVTALLAQGWLVFRCPSESTAMKLKSQVKGMLVRCSVLASTGVQALNQQPQEPERLSETFDGLESRECQTQ